MAWSIIRATSGASCGSWAGAVSVPPGGRWSDLAILETVRDYKARHASTLLVFDAVEDAIAQIEKKQSA